nr:MAG TPA: hypothetical protein [Bacteriophage sp.]DAV37440.1 MAG TPA: hypothetical protein [Caudoviricetes sp.]
MHNYEPQQLLLWLWSWINYVQGHPLMKHYNSSFYFPDRNHCKRLFQ